MEMLYLLIMLLMSAFALGTMAWDKRQARRGGWRVPERVLWAMAVLLGAPGEYLGMRAFRHRRGICALRSGFRCFPRQKFCWRVICCLCGKKFGYRKGRGVI